MLGATVLRKNNAPVMQHGPRGRTRGEVRSGRSAPQFGLAGRNDAYGVAGALGKSEVDPECLAPRRSVVCPCCNAATTIVGFSEGAPQSTGSSNPDIHAGVSRLAFRTANWPLGSERV